MHWTDSVGDLSRYLFIRKVVTMEDFCYNAECQWCFETVDGEMACALTIDDDGFTLCANMTVCPEIKENKNE